MPMNAHRRETITLDEASPPTLVLVHQNEAHCYQQAIPPTRPAQKPGSVQRAINAPFSQMRGRHVLVDDHADRSFASTCGTMPSRVAGPAVGIEMQTRASFCVAPLNG